MFWEIILEKLFGKKNNTIRIGFINYWRRIPTSYFQNTYIFPLQKAGLNVDITPYNPRRTKCDIVFYSVFGEEKALKRCKGEPLFIHYSGENRTSIPAGAEHYSLTFNKDSDKNLYFPLWQLQYAQYNMLRRPKNQNKNKFCTFIIGNTSPTRRIDAFKALNEYKRVDSCGRSLNNMEDGFTLPVEMDKCIEFHNDYKFNLCFENSKSIEGSNYITEKLINAYFFGTVPIYWGDDEVEKWFNPKSFINANGKTIKELVDIVKFYDTHDKDYYEMLNQPMLNEDIDIEQYLTNRYVEFMKKITEPTISKKG